MTEHNTNQFLKGINEQFVHDDHKYVTAEELSKYVPIYVEKILSDVEKLGIDQVSILQRRIQKRTIKSDGSTEDLYRMEFSVHPPYFSEDLIMYDSSLITYTILPNGLREQEVNFDIGSCEEGEKLGQMPLEAIEHGVKLCLEDGNEIYARKLKHTYDAYFKIKEREQQ